MAILSKEALKRARRNKELSQEDLASAADVDPSTISRMERGIQRRVRKYTLTQLAVALEIQPEELCEAPESEPDLVKLPMNAGARNALALVAKRYRVSRRSIIELAPLLFYIVAEQSLIRRHQRLDEIRNAAASLNDLQRTIPHLPHEWFIADQFFDPEGDSIKARDLFGVKIVSGGHDFPIGYVDEYDEAKDNPLAAYLNEALEAVGGNSDDDVRCPHFGEPSYSICWEEAAELVGGDENAARAIVYGDVALHEMPKGTPEQRAEWARTPRVRLADANEEPVEF